MLRQPIYVRMPVVVALIALLSSCGIKGPLRPPPKAAQTPPASSSTNNPATSPPTTSPALPPPTSTPTQ
ncbi:MAG TPA: lipoprotein [Casimicrobiaceae bacterium]|nr:lipoprotein [Casimicrobiaceae bacterium]